MATATEHLARDSWSQYCRTLATVRRDIKGGADVTGSGRGAGAGVGAGAGASDGGCCDAAALCESKTSGWSSTRIDYREGGAYSYLNTGTGMVERNCVLFPDLAALLPPSTGAGDGHAVCSSASCGGSPAETDCASGGDGGTCARERGFGECTERQRALWNLVHDEFAAHYTRDGVAWCIWVEHGSPAHTFAEDLTLMPRDTPAGCCGAGSSPASPFFEVWPEQGMVLTLGSDTRERLLRFRPAAGSRDGTFTHGGGTLELLPPDDDAGTAALVKVLCDAYQIPAGAGVRGPVTALLSGRTWGTGTPLRIVAVRDNDTNAVVAGGSLLMLDDGSAAIFEVRHGAHVNGGVVCVKRAAPMSGLVVQLLTSMLCTTRCPHTRQVCVAKSHRRRGIATAIMVMLIDLAVADGAKHVALQASEEGAAVYRRLGFVSSGSFDVFVHFPSAAAADAASSCCKPKPAAPVAAAAAAAAPA